MNGNGRIDGTEAAFQNITKRRDSSHRSKILLNQISRHTKSHDPGNIFGTGPATAFLTTTAPIATDPCRRGLEEMSVAIPMDNS